MESQYVPLTEVFSFRRFVMQVQDDDPVKNPKSIEPSCKDCLAACCLVTNLELTFQEKQLLISNGTVFDTMLGSRRRRLNTYLLERYSAIDDLFDLAVQGTSDLSLQIITALEGGPEAVKKLPDPVQKVITLLSDLRRQEQQINMNIQAGLIGVCGCIIHGRIIGKQPLCRIYDDRPQICHDFPEGESTCQRLFISNESDAAREIVVRMNRLEPTLRLLSVLTGIASREIGEFS